MIKINQVLTEFRIPAGEQKLVYQFKGFTASQMDELHAMLHRAGIVTTPDFNKRTITTYSNRDAMKLKKNKSIQRFIKSKGGKQIKEGTCGYGVNGKLGEEPAGPNLRKKIKDISKDKNESVGSRGYDGRDWFWPHDFRHYLRDASPAQRKKIHDAWLKIGIPVKKTGLKISDRYLQPKKNQLKKAWTIVRKVVAPKELGMPIPESVNEAKYKGYDYKRQNRKDGLPLIVPALQKTFSNMKDLKKYIDKHGTMESVNEAFRPSDRKVLMVIGRDIIRNLNKTYHKGTLTPSKQLGQALNSIFRAMTRDKGDANYQQYKKYFPKYNDKLLKRLSKAYFNEPVNVQNTFIKKVMDYSLKESVSEGLNSSGYSQLSRSIKALSINIKDLAKAHKKQDDSVLRNEIDNLMFDVKRMVKIIDNKKYNESVNERMDKRQAGEMLKQLGGNKFIAMTGAKNFAVGPKGASFKIGRNSKNVNYVRIDLKNDLYDMEFIQMRAGKMKVKSKVKQIYADQLQQMFTKHTGMYTSL